MASIGFRWLDILEKEFDKAFVDLDLTVGELDSEEPVIVYNVRQKLCTLSSCFAQLTHKAQTIFQNSAKIEAELIHMRAELVDSKARRDILEQELHNLLLQLHAAQLAQIHAKANEGGGGALLLLRSSSKPEPPDVAGIRRRLDVALRKSPSHIISAGGVAAAAAAADVEFAPQLVALKQLRCENDQLQQENVALRNQALAMASEVYGAKLAAKYLDKELAGRIQQLQLLGREMRGDVRDKLWRQLESEILLQRHKTVVRECRRNSILNGSEKTALTAAAAKRDLAVPTHTEHFGDVRTVVVRRKPSQGLGISITGGREHGVPILISELESNGPAALSGELYIGDAILSVNEKDLRQACHKDAVDVLKQPCEECRLQVQYIAADDSDNSLEEDGFHFRFFDNDVVCEPGCNFSTPTAPRTPESVSHQSGNERDLFESSETVKAYQVSPEIQKVIDSLQSKGVYGFALGERDAVATPNNNTCTKDFLTGDDDVHLLNDINRNGNETLILLDNRRDEVGPVVAPAAIVNINCSTNSLNSENLSSPMQTSTDMCGDSEVLSTDAASNDSADSPKTSEAKKKNGVGVASAVVDVVTTACSVVPPRASLYGSNETLSNTKSDQSLLNSSCESSPIHTATAREYKKPRKCKPKKYFGVKTLQSIFGKHDGYSDISSNASDDEQQAPKEADEATQPTATTTTYKFRGGAPLAQPSAQFEENVHAFLSDIFMKNFQAPGTPETSATTSRVGAKRYLRVGKALRLCSNEDGVGALNELEQRREKLLARYVYSSHSVSADGEGNPDFGTPV